MATPPHDGTSPSFVPYPPAGMLARRAVHYRRLSAPSGGHRLTRRRVLTGMQRIIAEIIGLRTQQPPSPDHSS